MKKMIFLLLAFVISNQLTAQIKKGQWLAGGNVNWTSTFNGNFYGNSTIISIMPDAGYFFIDKLAGGLKLNYTIVNPSSGLSYVDFGFSPFVRYYFLPTAKTINIFTEAAYGWGRNTAQGGNITNHQWSLSAGPAFFLNPHVALEVAVVYTNTAGQQYTDGNPETIGINIGFQVYLGK